MTRYTQEMITTSLELQRTRAAAYDLERKIEALVTAGKEQGMTWSMIGIALGTSGQAAWERYGLTGEEKLERSRQNNRPADMDTFPGLEVTRDQRVAARKVALERKRAKGTQHQRPEQQPPEIGPEEV